MKNSLDSKEYRPTIKELKEANQQAKQDIRIVQIELLKVNPK